MRKKSSIILLTFSLFLQGCTVARFNLNDELTGSTSLYRNGEKTVYHITLSAKPEQFTREVVYTPEQIKRIESGYSKSTKRVFQQAGVIAEESRDRDKATFLINVDWTPLFSALPQEYCTGLSFGIIPSWGTRHSEYVYTFEKVGESDAHTYTVDCQSFNHLICFPVFWTLFFTMDESKIYEKSLRNYLLNNEISHPRVEPAPDGAAHP